MKRNRISDRYAKVYFDLAKGNNKIDLIKKDVDLIHSVYNESPDFMHFFESPVINKARKLNAFNSVFRGKIDDLSINFLRLVIENNRETYLPGMCRSFNILYLAEKGVKEVYMTAAVAFGKATVEQIKMFLENELKSKIELHEKVDPRLIGGFIMRIDDREIDASVATILRKMKSLMSND